MSDNAFVYVTYVKAAPEQVWRALTEPEYTTRYWGVAFATDWTPGSPMTWDENGATTFAPGQEVLESDRPRRLAYTWHTFTPEWAERVGVTADVLAKLAAEPRSKVRFELEPAGGAVKLTVTHDGFPDPSTARDMVSEGWPMLLSSLKSLLETGEPIAD
ncbi:SRPBCC family protein [Glycomyces sp. NPDC047010]|uniref:SRPBCC family protein n=1 Tax=Glycomyces sp. NPDC047010 TaxID=3155023 RepID=UPI0033EFB79E